MKIKIPESLAEMSVEGLAALATEVREAGRALAATETPTAAELAEAQELSDALDGIEAQIVANTEAAEAAATQAAALRARFAVKDEPEPPEEPAEETQPPEQPPGVDPPSSDPQDGDPDADPAQATPEAKKAARSTVVTLSTKTKRPTAPRRDNAISITAAANVPDFTSGQALSMDQVGEALVSQMRTYSPPSGTGEYENLQHTGVAKFRMNFEDDLTIPQHGDDMAVLSHAANESRLSGNSLVAAGGWCAPSETLYDMCVNETLDGILSVPEVNVTRGGIKYTSGPDFSAIYSNTGFTQTEAQAIAGTAKTCYEVPCPPFTEVRLDVVGLCIKAPILTNAAYPELVNRWLSGAMIAHAHKVNASVISRMVTAAGTANTVQDFGGTAASTLGNLELLADRLRQKYVVGMKDTMEVVVPFWIRGAIRNDLALRTGQNVQAITDAMIDAEFSARNLNVQFVYDWQALPDQATTEGYPATYQALIYPSGTFVKGTSDVISLNSVYDAASLAVNVYTAVFFEQGLLVAKMCNEAMLVTLAVCNAGRTGIANIAQCGTGA